MNELIDYVITCLKAQKGLDRYDRKGICYHAHRCWFKDTASYMRLMDLVDTLPLINFCYCFPLTDEGDLERIKWLEAQKTTIPVTIVVEDVKTKSL